MKIFFSCIALSVLTSKSYRSTDLLAGKPQKRVRDFQCLTSRSRPWWRLHRYTSNTRSRFSMSDLKEPTLMTSSSVNPKWFAWLTNELLSAFALLLMSLKQIGLRPSQIDFVIIMKSNLKYDIDAISCVIFQWYIKRSWIFVICVIYHNLALS